ncbi:MAG: hypothetical protein JSR73_03200 [Proteobacteria bacterium]|nr:hypothetical protein [Pseudomonadota bacterium]
MSGRPLLTPTEGSVMPNRYLPLKLAPVLAAAVLVAVGPAQASTPTRDRVHAAFQVVSRGQHNVIDVVIRPTDAFENVHLEAGSGVAGLTGVCSFPSVVAGASYHCRIEVDHVAGTPALTLKVVGERAMAAGGAARVADISRFSLPNPDYRAPLASAKAKPVRGLVSTPAPGTPKN